MTHFHRVIMRDRLEGDCPGFTDGAKQSRRIGTVPVNRGDSYGY